MKWISLLSRIMARCIITLFIVWGAFFSLSAFPQAFARPVNQNSNNTNLESVAVDIWPEYDKPSVLVMYNISLSAQVKLPATLTIRIPASVGQPSALATKDANGLFDLSYTTAPDGDWTQIIFTTSTPDVHLEYYDPSMTIQNQKRNYTYRWPGDFTVNNLSIKVQQPVNATNMTFRPAVGSGLSDLNGLTYYSLLVGQVKAGTPFELQLSYLKPDNTLTNSESFSPVKPSQAIDEQTPGRITLNEILPWTLGILGILLIGAGGYWYWRTGVRVSLIPASAHAKRVQRHSSASQNADAPDTKVQDGKGSEGVYCHQCGKRANTGDAFCRACGTKLHS